MQLQNLQYQMHSSCICVLFFYVGVVDLSSGASDAILPLIRLALISRHFAVLFCLLSPFYQAF